MHSISYDFNNDFNNISIEKSCELPTYSLGAKLEISDYRLQIDQLAKVLESLDCSWQIIKMTQGAVQKQFQGLLNQRTATHFLVELDNLIQVFPVNYSDPNRLRTLINVLLKHQLEYLWYQDFPVYADPPAVAADSQLWDLRSGKHKYQINFGFTVLREDIFHKVINPLKRQLRVITNHPAQGTVGMKITKCKPEMLALLNEITQQATQHQFQPHRLQINSILRTVDHQKHLASLGYWAPPTSSHTTGYAADIEQSWYWHKKTMLFRQIQTVLNRYYQEGIINLIDERKVWHICLNPQFREIYLQKSQLSLKA